MNAKELLSRIEECKDASDIADLCRENGVRGVPLEPRRCAFAQLLVTGADDVRKAWACNDLKLKLVDGEYARPLTTVEFQFIHAFDAEAYPDLIEE